MTHAVYTRLCESAEAVLAGGYSALIDATFATREQRRQLIALSTRLGVRIGMIHCRADLATLRARLADRHRAGTDASEADEAVLDWQLRRLEPIAVDEGIRVIELDTDHKDPVASAELAIRSHIFG